METTQKTRQMAVDSCRELGKLKFHLGIQVGEGLAKLKPKRGWVTMAELDAHYEELLRDIEELQEQMKETDGGRQMAVANRE